MKKILLLIFAIISIKSFSQDTIIKWMGDKVTVNTQLRDKLPTVTDSIDADGDLVNDDVSVSYPFSLTTPLSPTTAGYLTKSFPFYGGAIGEALDIFTESFDDRGVGNSALNDPISIRFQNTIANPGNFHSVFFFKKENFTANGNSSKVSFSNSSKIIISSINNWENLKPCRWLVYENDTCWVSEVTFTAAANATVALTFSANDNDGKWAVFKPEISMNFDTSSGGFIDKNFSNISGVGFITDNDAFDDKRKRFTFATFIVSADVATTCKLSADKQNIFPSETVTLSANVQSSNTVTKVDFYEGTNKINTLLSPPYEITVSPALVGTYNYKAVAYDNMGDTALSKNVTVFVRNILMSNPSKDTVVNFYDTLLLASKNNFSGTITKVNYYKNDTLIGTSTVNPYTIKFKSVLLDSAYYKAIIYNNIGDSAISNSVKIKFKIITSNKSVNVGISTLHIYPNPANEVINIVSQNNENTVILYDITGNQILNKVYNLNKFKLDITKIKKGNYILRINDISTLITKY